MPGLISVRKANKALSSQLLPSSVHLDLCTTHDFRIALAEELHTDERDTIWAIFDDNMRELYRQSSFGWNPASKLAELFDPLSRFILVRTGGQLVAFVMFRFEYERGESILYCYDLQVSSMYQRTGLGKLLMKSLEGIARAWSMEKIVLTVFKVNHTAIKFYDAAGFEIDPSSPCYVEGGDDLESADYKILSKELNKLNQ